LEKIEVDEKKVIKNSGKFFQKNSLKTKKLKTLAGILHLVI
jgi:hypothetical protein